MNARFLLCVLLAALAPSMAQAQTPQATPAPLATPAAQTNPDAGGAASDDPNLWLESIDAPPVLDWVKARDAETVKEFASSPQFETTRAQILEVLDSNDRIPYAYRMGKHLYNFWRDKDHPHGIWRRTTLAEYRKAAPKWEPLIDVDALGAAEKTSWVWHGADCLKPDYRHCIISLSRGGADADVAREYDLTTKSFVKGGFELPEAKTDTSWIDANTLYVGTDFGPDSMTRSGYPRIAKKWKRGTKLADATLVYEGKPDDISVSAWHDATPGFETDQLLRRTSFFASELYLLEGDKQLRIEVPDDAMKEIRRGWLTVRLRTDWKVAEHSFVAGSLLTMRLDDFLAGKRDFVTLFTPTKTRSLSGTSWTKHHLILNILEDVTSRIEVLTPQAGAWKREPMALPPLISASLYGTDPDNSDEAYLVSNGFLTEETLSWGEVGKGPLKPIKHGPSFFDTAPLDVHQYFVASKDGTRIPYFVIAPKALKADGANPTLLYGYGGFEISLDPHYSGAQGRAWLSRGGVYVIANIRGGGEYGPSWHKAALKANRLRAYEDFAAVAQDLVARKITSRPHLGIMGGSNGGLLMGNMLTLYPELFGAVVCQVPLLDMKRYTHLSAGASWIEEYGDPDKPEEWAFLQTFSPYQNLKAGVTYPPVLFTTSTRDDRVGPVHARKMAARMISMGQAAWLYENIEGGHGAAADNKQAAFMSALGYEFLWSKIK